MKSIVIVSAVFPPEQVTSAYLNYDLAHELAKNYDVTVLRPYPTRPVGTLFETPKVKDKSFNTILIESYTFPESKLLGRFRESIDFGRKSVDYIKRHHQNISFVYNDGWQLFGLHLLARACKKYNIPYMVPIQDIYPECLFTDRHYPSFLKSLITSILLPIDKYYQKHAAYIRTISNEMRDYLAKTRGIDKEKYLVVNNWQNDDYFMEDYPKRQDDEKLVFAYVGSINGHANVDLMIRAFVEASIPNSEFRIYGGGNKKEYCLQLVKELGVENIVFDMVNRDKVAFIQSQTDVLVLALPKGNGNLCLPSKMTSYMLSGKPILASIDGDSATNRIIQETCCGYTVEPDSIDSLSVGFRNFQELSKKQLEEMGNNALQYSRKHLTKACNLKLVIDKIEEIIN